MAKSIADTSSENTVKETNPLTTVVESQPEATVDPTVKVIATDEYAGHGGSYTYDPSTGTRTLNPD